jgi:hypothetical protein
MHQKDENGRKQKQFAKSKHQNEKMYQKRGKRMNQKDRQRKQASKQKIHRKADNRTKPKTV